MINNTSLEFHEQVAFVEYLQLLQEQGKIQLFTAIPQNLYTRSWNQKRKQKMEGVRPGFPDLCIVTNKDLILIEMKRVKGGVLSPHQKKWIKALNSVGIKAFVAKGFDEAKKLIDGEL